MSLASSLATFEALNGTEDAQRASCVAAEITRRVG